MRESSEGNAKEPLSAHLATQDHTTSPAPFMHAMSEAPGAGVEESLIEEATATENIIPESSVGNTKEPPLAHLAAPELVLGYTEEPSTVEPAAMESVSMEEHLQQIMRAAEEREQQDQEVDAAPAPPAPRRRSRPKKQVHQFRGNLRKK